MIESVISDFFKIPDFTEILGSEIRGESSNKRYRNKLFRCYFTLLN